MNWSRFRKCLPDRDIRDPGWHVTEQVEGVAVVNAAKLWRGKVLAKKDWAIDPGSSRPLVAGIKEVPCSIEAGMAVENEVKLDRGLGWVAAWLPGKCVNVLDEDACVCEDNAVAEWSCDEWVICEVEAIPLANCCCCWRWRM